MIGPSEIGAIAVGMILGALALAYLIILTLLRISMNRRRRYKPTNG